MANQTKSYAIKFYDEQKRALDGSGQDFEGLIALE